MNFTKAMRANGVKYVADIDGKGFQVVLFGGAFGTGETVGDALENAIRQRDAMQPDRKAA
jgi:hypothetical protein